MYGIVKTYGNDRGLSACFRQWAATSHCNQLHGYALGFRFELEAETLDGRNWVYDFGGFKPVKEWLEKNFDHKLLVASNDPHLDEICALAGYGIADVMVLERVGCEAFAEMAFFAADIVVQNCPIAYGRVRVVRVDCFEHASNGAFYRA